MKKIFSILIAIEGILTILLFTVFADNCGSGCGPDRSFLLPFGKGSVDGLRLCPAVCQHLPHEYFYITFDLLLATFVVFIVYLVFNRRNN